MATTEDSILRRVRGLVAKANATEFEAERESFMAKADELMEKYAIDQALLLMQEDSSARVVIRRDMDIDWWYELRGLDYEVRSRIHSLWRYCVEFCRCYQSTSTWDYQQRIVPVYGIKSDLDYLELLFTDLFLQMSLMLKPKYDPNLSLGENVYHAKNAGMKYTDIAIWSGHPEWVEQTVGKRGGVGFKSVDGGRMKHAYQRFLNEHRPGESRITMHPLTYIMSFMDGYVTEIHRRFRSMRSTRDESNGSGMELVIRDIRKQALEAFYDDFPEFRPHPADCQCDVCKAARMPVKSTGRRVSRAVSKSYGRQLDYSAISHGSRAGGAARIVTVGDKVASGKKGELT